MPNPLTAAPALGQKDTQACHWCDKIGHVLKDCKANACDEAQVAKYVHPARRLSARSLEEDWEQQVQRFLEEICSRDAMRQISDCGCRLSEDLLALLTF